MIPYFDYRPRLREIREEIDAAVGRVLHGGRLVLGPEVTAFEGECAGSVGRRAGVGVNSGTDALELALRALGVGAGDEVLTVANAGVPPVAAIRAAGATPRFVDVDPGTLLMDAAAAREAVNERTRAILPVHLYGQAAPVDDLVPLAEEHGIALVEDCAQAQGATHAGRPVGSFGAVSCFSFYPTKTLGALGDGGLCAVDDAGLEGRLRSLRMYGYRDDGHAHEEGRNSRLDEIQAAVLRVKLRYLGDDLRQRAGIAARYRDGLRETPFRAVDPVPEATHAHHLFVIRCPRREAVADALRKAGIGFGIHYPEPVHLMEAYRFLGCAEGDLPVTEKACREVLSLPIYPGLGRDRVDRVVDALRGVPDGA